MMIMKDLFHKLTERPTKQLIGIIIVAYSVFTLIILFAFVPTSLILSETGYSTSDLQMATNSDEVTIILSAWSDVKSTVYLQYFADFIFLCSGLIGNSTIFVLLGKKINEKGSTIPPLVGFLSVFLSRGLDALENTLTLILISFPNSYPKFILSILPYIPPIKFAFVGIVYTLILITGMYFLLVWRKSKEVEIPL